MRCLLATSSLAAVIGVCPAQAKDDAVLVGVLEHGFMRSPQGARGTEFMHVRFAFKRTATGWEALPHDPRDLDALLGLADAYPPVVTWTISFDGRSLGAVTTRRRRTRSTGKSAGSMSPATACR